MDRTLITSTMGYREATASATTTATTLSRVIASTDKLSEGKERNLQEKKSMLLVGDSLVSTGGLMLTDLLTAIRVARRDD